jgi:hypothetical protein
MPDGAGPLSNGRDEFRSLPGASVQPWDGMRDAVGIAGEPSPRSKELFTSIESYDAETKLWDYRLLRDGQVVLSIGDFSDLLIRPTDEDRARLTALGIPPDDWQPSNT